MVFLAFVQWLGSALEPFTTASTTTTTSSYGSAYGRRERVEGGLAEVLDVSDAAGAEDCPTDGGVRARIQLIDGIGLQEDSQRKPIGRVRVQSADVCLHVCRQNAVNYKTINSENPRKTLNSCWMVVDSRSLAALQHSVVRMVAASCSLTPSHRMVNCSICPVRTRCTSRRLAFRTRSCRQAAMTLFTAFRSTIWTRAR